MPRIKYTLSKFDTRYNPLAEPVKTLRKFRNLKSCEPIKEPSFFLMENLNHLRNLNRGGHLGDFVSRIKVPYKTVGGWFEGRALPQTEHLKKISDTYMISIDDLVRKQLSKNPIYTYYPKYERVQKRLITNIKIK